MIYNPVVLASTQHFRHPCIGCFVSFSIHFFSRKYTTCYHNVWNWKYASIPELFAD